MESVRCYFRSYPWDFSASIDFPVLWSKVLWIFFTCFLLCNILQSVAALGLHKAGMRFISIGHERSDYNMILDDILDKSKHQLLILTKILLKIHKLLDYILMLRNQKI